MFKVIYFLLLFSFNLFAVSIETTNKKNIENVKILKDTAQEIEYVDEDGKISRIDRSYVTAVKEDGPKKPEPPKVAVTQIFGNELVFQGIPLYGDRLARRNGDSYKSFNEGYNVMTSVAMIGLPKGFEMDVAAANPMVGRTNTDRDQVYQNSALGTSQNQTVINSLNSGSLLFDPNSTKIRNENNKLLDYFFTRFHFNHETKLGTFGIGAITIHTTDPAYSMRFLYAVSWKMPFLQYLNPNVTMYYNMLNESSGAYQGNKNVRFNISHKYEIEKDFSFTPSITVGYLDANNNLTRQKGIGDITTNLRFGYLSYFLSFNHVRRSDTLFDNQLSFPTQGTYANTVTNDGMVADPSRVYGNQNNYIINQISQNVSDENAKKALINQYQNQRIIKDIFYISLGYTLKF